jgi:hypothetical protein
MRNHVRLFIEAGDFHLSSVLQGIPGRLPVRDAELKFEEG